MAEINLIEQSVKNGFRFALPTGGQVSTEDLYSKDLPTLNEIAVAINQRVKAANEESFIATKTKNTEVLELQLEVVKHIINGKIAERDAKLVAKAKRDELEKLDRLIEEKEDLENRETPLAELKAKREALLNS